MTELLTYLHEIYPLSEPLKEYLSEKLIRKEIPKKDFILKKGRVCEDIYFIEKGLVRCYHIDENEKDEKEITDWFMSERDVIISVESFLEQTPSEEYILAMEDCILYSISFKELEYAYETFRDFNIHGRKITGTYYLQSIKREKYLKKPAPERYKFMMDHQPQLILRVPSKYIASYLGIDEATLSRIRGGKY